MSGICAVVPVESVTRMRTLLPVPDAPLPSPGIVPPLEQFDHVLPPLRLLCTRTVPPVLSEVSQVITEEETNEMLVMLVLGDVQVPDNAAITPKLSNGRVS